MVLATGRVWTERMFGHQATGRLRSMAAEASCGTRHTVVQRTARWLVRLGETSAFGRRINITQAVLAQVLGVQRTTANAALRMLQEQRLISTVRGSITLLSYGGLREIACDCGRWASSTLRQAEPNPVQIDLPGAPSEPSSFARP